MMAYFKFLKEFLYFVSFVRRNSKRSLPTHNFADEIVVVVTPWMGTSVPWFSVTLGLLLAREGRKVTFLFDDIQFGAASGFYHFQKTLIEITLKMVKNIPYKVLSTYLNGSDGNEGHDVIKNLSSLNSLHFTRGETNTKARSKYEEKIYAQLSYSYRAYRNFFKKNDKMNIVVPGGIWGNSGVLKYFAEKSSSRFSTYDSGSGILLFSLHGVAAQLKDVPYVFKHIKQSEEEFNFAVDSGMSQLVSRMNGNDRFSFFNTESKTLDDDGYYLMLLNSVWDSAALGLHTVYDSMIEWIFDSVDWVLENTDRKIVIRQHPAERQAHINNSDDYRIKICKRYNGNERIQFIEASVDISSYKLMEKASCILGFSSTSIVEAVALGKPAIIVSSVYYANLGVVVACSSKDMYYKFLKDVNCNALNVTKEQKENACALNYVTQKCNWIHTSFTPHSCDFAKWVKMSMEQLSTELIVQALLRGEPSSYLNHIGNYRIAKGTYGTHKQIVL